MDIDNEKPRFWRKNKENPHRSEVGAGGEKKMNDYS